MNDQMDNLKLWFQDMGFSIDEVRELVRREALKKHSDLQHNFYNSDKTNLSEPSPKTELS
jgi:hypothetical protein